MNEQSIDAHSTGAPVGGQLHVSRRQIFVGTATAALAAAAILVLFVLPAEYGIDPTGMGRLLGLAKLGEAKLIAANNGSGEVMHAHPRKFYSGNIVIEMAPGEQLEYKATLARGEPMLYSWRVTGGSVYAEFHGEPTEGEWPKNYFRSYEIQKSSTAAHGSFVAPFTGQHGWYWRNLGDRPATITLEASGYYTRLGRVGKAAVE
jgi:hypothetical protein